MVTAAELEARPHEQEIIPWHLVENGLVEAPIEAQIRAHFAHLCLPRKVIILTEVPRDPATHEAYVRLSRMVRLADFVLEQPRTPRVPGKVRSKWEPHGDAVPWLGIYGDDEGRNRSMGNMTSFEPGTPIDYLRFASDCEQGGTFDIYVPSRLNRQEPPQGILQRCYLENLVKSEFPDRMDPAFVRVWIKPKWRAPQATLRQLSALVDEWRHTVRAAPRPLGGEVVILARDLVSTHDGGNLGRNRPLLDRAWRGARCRRRRRPDGTDERRGGGRSDRRFRSGRVDNGSATASGTGAGARLKRGREQREMSHAPKERAGSGHC